MALIGTGKVFSVNGDKMAAVDRNKDTDLLENGLEDMGRGRGEM